MGLPSRRDEYWKYTRPDTLTQADAPEAALFTTDEAPVFNDFDRLKIVFVDGVFSAAQSDDLSLEGIEIARLADQADISWASELYGVLETKGQSPVERPLAALNTALASDGVLIRCVRTPSKPVSLIYRHESTTSDATLHHVVKVEAGASLTLLENGPAAARFNKCLEVLVADGAEFHHVRRRGATTSAVL
jgi:Fe-S cluster assembly protein SufD